MKIKDSGERRKFGSGAHRDISFGKGRFDLKPPETDMALAQYFEEGGTKYADRNWEKGLPVSCFIDSAERHLNKFIAGLADENHLVAAIWNLHCVYATILRIQKGLLPEELFNLPNKIQLPDPYAEGGE